MKIVVLEAHTADQGHLPWSALREFGALTIHPRSTRAQALQRVADAEVVVVNKTIVDAEFLHHAPKLRFVSILATGFNTIDLDAVRERGIVVSNAPGYSTEGVAQHVFALLLSFRNRVRDHHLSVQRGEWATAPDFCYALSPIYELRGKTLGIYGFGQIGQRVAELGAVFGMTLLAHRRHPDPGAHPHVRFVDAATLLRESDVLTLHAPLNEDSRDFIRTEHLKMMKPSALLVNTARGGLVVEADLRRALLTRTIRGACLDVLRQEPPTGGNVLMDAPNCLITPHIAWLSVESRRRLMDITAQNIRAFSEGTPQNRVDQN